MATTNAVSGGADEPRQPKPSGAAYERSGFFTIYKSGQGYWTRLGTGIAATIIVAFAANFLWTQLRLVPLFLEGGRPRTGLLVGVVGAFVVGASALVWWLMNKPTNADFLIATDSEMKKVNWTSRKDLIGSTKVVILFMFMIAAFLFVCDIIFGYLFYLINVLKTPPLG